VNIDGRVESFETALFTKDPAVDISILNFDPDFLDVNTTSHSANTVSTTARELFPYLGSVEAGIVFTLNVNRTLPAFTIYHTSPDGSLVQMDFAGDLIAGDVLKISTVAGNKYAQRTRAGTVSSILYGISPQSKWIELLPGDNYIRVYATGAAVPYTIQYTNRYGGL
jgi:hypothetical protein